MTPDQVRMAIVAHRPMAQHDPEFWHGVVDSLHRQVLAAIKAGSPHAPELAAAVLEADDVPAAWHACA